MDASNSTATVGDFRVADLRRDLEQFPENAQLIKDAEEVIAGMIAKIKPVLRYITAPVPLIHNTLVENKPQRAVKVMEENGTPSFPNHTILLFLDKDSDFHAALEPCDLSGPLFKKVWVDEKNLWERFRFGKVFDGLEHLFMVATAKSRQHTESYEKRLIMMQKLKAIVSEPL